MPRSTKVSPQNDRPSAPDEGGMRDNFIPPTEAQLREIAAELVPMLAERKPLRPPGPRIEAIICDVCGSPATSQNLDDWLHAIGERHREALRRRVAEGTAAPGDADTLAVLDAEADALGGD